MTRKLDLPNTANQADPAGDGRLFAPSAARNTGPISDLLASRLGPQGRLLEIASGTGEHITSYATRLPGWRLQPSDIDPDRIASIAAWIAHSGETNVAQPGELDAAQPGWGVTIEPVDAVFISNLFHLIPEAATRTILTEATQALKPGGKLIVYGPFMRAGELTSEGDAAFHASLSGHDPDIGYKDDFDMIDWMQSAGLEPLEVVEMPSNNLAFLCQRVM